MGSVIICSARFLKRKKDILFVRETDFLKEYDLLYLCTRQMNETLRMSKYCGNKRVCKCRRKHLS